MRGLNPDRICELMRKDVELIKLEAKLVLEITSEGLRLHRPKNQRLDIIAVIGPVENSIISEIKNLNEAVLLEIGFRRAKPYHELPNRQRKNGEPSNFPIRRQWFALSEEQYAKVFPAILRILQKITDDRVHSWKCIINDDPYLIPTTKHQFSKKGRKISLKKRYMAYPQGIRFSVARKDELIIRYIYWTELHLNNRIKEHLKGLAKFIDMALSKHKGYKRNFSKLKLAREISDMISRKKQLPQYQMEEMIETYLPKGYKNQLINEIIDLLGYNREKSRERLLASSAISIKHHPQPPQIMVKTGLDKNKDHIVFEILPSCIRELG